MIAFYICLTLYCAFGLPITIYFTAAINTASESYLTIYSIDWTIFGIIVAIIGIFIGFSHSKPQPRMDPFLAVRCIATIAGAFFVCLQLSFVAICLLSGNNRLSISIIYSTLYFVCIVFMYFLNVVFRLATEIIKNNKQNNHADK